MNNNTYRMIKSENNSLVFYEVDNESRESKNLLTIKEPTSSNGTILTSKEIPIRAFKDISLMLNHCLNIFRKLDDFPRVAEFSCDAYNKLTIDDIIFWGTSDVSR